MTADFEFKHVKFCRPLHFRNSRNDDQTLF